MMNFLKENSYLIFKMLVNQIGMTMFGLVLSMATHENNTLLLITSIFAVLFYMVLLYTMTWDAGYAEKIRIENNRLKFVPLKGLYMSLVANIPNIVLGILAVIGYYGSVLEKGIPVSPEWAVNLRGGCEETTTGVIRIRNRAKAGRLNFPMFSINDADCKHLFDNRYGTGQSVWDGIMRTTNLNVARSTVVVAGYGWCGKGVSMRAKGMGAKVIVTEVDAVKAIEAVMDGFTVMPMDEAAPLGDIFITVTGCDGVVTAKHMLTMKDGAIMCNAGHFDVEVDVAGLRAMAKESCEIRRNIEAYTLENGKTVYLLGEGRLVNLACGDGHPVEIMDMSFALQFACALRMAEVGKTMKPDLYDVPKDIDQEVALRKLTALGVKIDTLTPEQEKYLHG